MRFASVLAVLLAFAAGFAVEVAPAEAGGRHTIHIPDDPRGEGELPYCSDERVLRKIVRLFRKADRWTWRRGLEIEAISRTYQRRVRHRTGYGSIGRRYCGARAHFNNGRRRTVHYLIEEHQGFASMSWNVEFCVVGLDRWLVHDAWCRTVRP